MAVSTPPLQFHKDRKAKDGHRTRPDWSRREKEKNVDNSERNIAEKENELSPEAVCEFSAGNRKEHVRAGGYYIEEGKETHRQAGAFLQ